MSTGCKGIYSMISTFMLVVVIVFVVLFLVYIGYSSIVPVNQLTPSIKPLQESGQVRDFVFRCIGTFDENKFDTSGIDSNCTTPVVSGYVVKMENFLGCSSKSWAIGYNDSCEKKYSYAVNIINSKGQKCLGRVYFCFKGV